MATVKRMSLHLHHRHLPNIFIRHNFFFWYNADNIIMEKVSIPDIFKIKCNTDQPDIYKLNPDLDRNKNVDQTRLVRHEDPRLHPQIDIILIFFLSFILQKNQKIFIHLSHVSVFDTCCLLLVFSRSSKEDSVWSSSPDQHVIDQINLFKNNRIDLRWILIVRIQ